jgi:hypothetical protein
MIAWSKGLGKKELTIDFSKCNVKREEGNLVLNGTLYPSLWDCKVTFMPEDLLGLMKLVFSFAMQGLIIRNLSCIYLFIKDKFILRRMGLKESETEASS